MKELFNDKRWKPILVLLCNLAMFEWVIFPGLTIANTFINMLTVLWFIALFLLDLNYVKLTYFTIPEEQKQLKADWKARVDEIQSEPRSPEPQESSSPLEPEPIEVTEIDSIK